MIGSPVQRILVAVDFSPCSGEALRFACALAAALGAAVEVIHVHETSKGPLDRPAPPGGTGAAEVRTQLHQFVAAAGEPPSVALTERLESGDVRERIVAVAEGESFDLIVIGTYGRTGRTHSLVGSVAESVVRTSSRPVLTVRESAHERGK